MKIYSTYITFGIIVILAVFAFLIESQSNGEPQLRFETKTNDTAETLQNKVVSQNEYKSIILSDEKLYQHYVAVKYNDTALTPESAIRFMVEAGILDAEICLGVALKETGLKSGVAKQNNLHGLKKARQRFSWAENWTPSNYCIFQNPYFSFLEMNEYIMTGSKIWSTYSIPQKYKDLIEELQMKGYSQW